MDRVSLMAGLVEPAGGAVGQGGEAIDAGTTFVRRGGPEVFRKVLITGVGRSGTTALSSLFTELGYHRGNYPLPPFGEDERFRRLLVRPDPRRLATELEAWSEQNVAVAWKDPKIFAAKGSSFLTLLPDDWLLIAIFRDPLAVTQRRVVSDGAELLPMAAHVAQFQSRLIGFLTATTKSVAMLSYEKLLTAPVATLDGLLPHVIHPHGPADTQSLWQVTSLQRRSYRHHADPANSNKGLS